MPAFRQLIHLETVFPLSCHGRCQHVDCAVLQSFDHLLRKVGRLEEKWLTETKKKLSWLKRWALFRKSEQIPKTAHFSGSNWSATQLDSTQE